MKAYMIITLNLCAMHGANMYIYNKTRFLREKGWQTFVFSAEQGDILIPGLREYSNMQYPCLRFYPACFSEKTINSFLDRVETDIDSNSCDEVVIESTNMTSALWGELLASRLGCKHLAFIMQERFSFSAREKDFVRFKLNRYELAGITEKSVGLMIGDENLPLNQSMRVRAVCTNTIDECEDPFSSLLDPSAAMTIGSIGRLEKPYVMPMLRELKKILSDGKKYNLVMVGGTRAQKQYEKIKRLFSDLPNVRLIITGYLFPIPKTLIDSCDFFISSAGSATATYYQKRPTIALNPNDGSIIGVTGLTYRLGEHTIYSDNYDISELERIIKLTLEKREEIEYVDDMLNGDYNRKMEEEFYRQLGFLGLSPAGDYYDTLSIKHEERKYRVFNILGKVLGPDILYESIDKARRILK